MILIFRRRKILKEISLENVEVEHDFSEGLSKRVTLNFFWQPSNLTRIGKPYDFAVARSYAKLAMAERLNYNICGFEQF